VAAKAPQTTYAQPPRTSIQQKPTQYSATYATTATTAAKQQQQQQPNATSSYTSYDTALYSAATAYMAQQNNKSTNQNQQQTGWPKKGNTFKQRKNVAPKPQQIHYCDVCKISCAGPQTYREHLEGQKHKKREALQKAQTDPQTPAPSTTQRGSNLRCELCDVTCTGNDAYSAHVRGSKHQKVVKLHTKLGKPIPSSEPTPIGTTSSKEGEVEETPAEDVKPVGEEYIEEMKDSDGKVVTFNCKLCDCKFNDPNAKEMHTKGRRHRLQYKKKVQPDLVVDVKPTLRQRKLAEREKQRQAMQEEFWNRRRMAEGEMDDDERMYWEERRRFEEEMGGGSGDWSRNFPMRGRPLMGFPPMFNMMNGRRVETLDDRHVIARHAEIYPKEEELQSIQRIVSHTERALKLVSDAMTVQVAESKTEEKMDETETEVKEEENKNGENKENQNQMISFQKDTEGTVRLLKGVMRVGLLAKGCLFFFVYNFL
jgi:zinc finger RNA-binding protein